MRKKLLLILACIALTGCGSDNGAETAGTQDSSNNILIALENSGDIPKLDRDQNMSGIDVDNDGVRDDIEQYIIETFPSEPERNAARQSAKALQKALLVDKSNIELVLEANKEIARADHCIYLTFDGNLTKHPARVSEEMESITTNTKERLLAYLEFSKALDGSAWTLPEGDTCEK